MNGISKLLSTDGYIQVNKALIKKLGLHESIMIGELCAEYNYWESQGKLDNDMFYSTRENIEENTGLSEHFQRKALATLKEQGIIEVTKRGIPAVNYYKINFDKLLTILSTSCSSRRQQETETVDLNNNKRTNIKNKESNSKELLQNSDFQFGKSKKIPKKDNLFTKCVSLIDSYDFAVWGNIRKLLIDYLTYRISVKDKPLYTNMWKGMLNKLAELGDDDVRLYEAIIKQSIERGYLSFYQLSTYSKNMAVQSESGSRHVPRMTDEDYAEEERRLAELEAKGVQVRF